MINLHPNVPAPSQKWANEETLHLAVAYSNPFRWNSRRILMNNFRAHISNMPNIKLYVGELAYGDRPFEVTDASNPQDIQLRANSELFHKENIINKVVERFDNGWKYGGQSDADFTFTQHDWALEAIHQLQHAPWVQPYSSYTSLTAKGYGGSQPGALRKSFAATYIENGHKLPPIADNGGFAPDSNYVKGVVSAPQGWVPVGATGGAWTFTHEGFATTGGFMEQAILGHGDWFMTFGLVSQATRGTIAASKFHPNYTQMIVAWQERAKALNANIGVVDQHAIHNFHGCIKNRGYETRDQIMVEYQFDPIADLKKNWQGIYELTGNKPGLRDAIRRYFINRNEDDPNGTL